MAGDDQTFGKWVSGAGRYAVVTAVAGLLAALALGYLGAQLSHRHPEVVYVRTNDVMARYKGSVQARESFTKDTSAWADESKQLEEKLQELGKNGKPSDPKLLEQGRQMASRIKALRDKAAQREQELMTPVLAEVNSGIKKFAQRHGYKLVVGTLQGGVILHGDESLDVTDALIQELNQ